jgi:hypothetical protein
MFRLTLLFMLSLVACAKVAKEQPAENLLKIILPNTARHCRFVNSRDFVPIIIFSGRLCSVHSGRNRFFVYDFNQQKVSSAKRGNPWRLRGL